MELSTQDSQGKYYLYNESFWTGKKSLTIDGKPATKIARKQLRCEEGENSVDYNIKGSFLTGVSILSSKGENIVLAKNKWYDWLFIFLPLLGMIFGVAFCGAIGGALSGLMCFSATVVNAVLSRTKLPLAGKIPLQILVTVVANGIWFGIYCLVVVAIFY